MIVAVTIISIAVVGLSYYLSSTITSVRYMKAENKILKQEIIKLLTFQQEQITLNKQLVQGVTIALSEQQTPIYYGQVGEA